MLSILTDGLAIFDRMETPFVVDAHQLNEPLHAARFSVEGARLEWVPESSARAALPLAPLRERALIARQVEEARVAHQERLLAVGEVERQRSELARLMRQLLCETVLPDAICVPHDPKAIWALDVTTTLDGLTFRVHDYRNGGYSLEVSLVCPVCHDVAWHRIDGLAGLGLLLRQLEDGRHEQDCSTCRAIAELSDDPFAGE